MSFLTTLTHKRDTFRIGCIDNTALSKKDSTQKIYEL